MGHLCLHKMTCRHIEYESLWAWRKTPIFVYIPQDANHHSKGTFRVVGRIYDKNCIYANLFILLAEIIEYYYFYAQIVRLCLHKMTKYLHK